MKSAAKLTNLAGKPYNKHKHYLYAGSAQYLT